MGSVENMIVHANFAKGFRGGERQTQLLIEELSKKDYVQKLLVRQGSELGHRCRAIKGLSIKEVTKPYILHIAETRGADLLHAHETKAAQFAYTCRLFLQVPYIITRRVDNRIKENFFNRLIYSNAHKTAVLSKAIQDEVLRVVPQASTTIIASAYSPLSLDKEKVMVLQKRFEGKFLVGNIGALDNTHKGQTYLIEAAKTLEKSHPALHFILLGSGLDEAAYKKQAKGLRNITFEGFVDNIGDYLSRFDLFVFPSLHEGLGSILFDVMRFEVPIIATEVGGIPDIIIDGKNGLLIPAGDPKAIEKSIIHLYNSHGTRASLIADAKASVEAYSPKIMADRYDRLYDEIRRD